MLSQLAPSEVKKLQRTLSSCHTNPYEAQKENLTRRSVDRLTSTLPRRYSVESNNDINENKNHSKSNLPIKSRDCDFSYERPQTSLREPKRYLSKSPESSQSESWSRNDDNFSTDSYSSLSRPSSYSKYSTDKYLAPSVNKNENRTSPRKISRFLRPDFYDTPKENVLVKEKKEREMETQKILKEIRDKRKNRLRRDRSSSRDKTLEDSTETNEILDDVSNNIKNLENNTKIHDYVNVVGEETKPNGIEEKKIHDYVNVKNEENNPVIIKKTKISRLVRPKSYPTESSVVPEKSIKTSPEKESRISKFRRGFTRQSSKEREKTKEDKNEINKNINEEEKGHKNKLLQTIEKKLEKFRSVTNTTNKNPQEIKQIKEKQSNVENAIKRLREQSLPRNLEHCTESGLIKRAVSVEDLSGSKPLQASRKSVTKILGLFKKYEDQDKNKGEKLAKKKKVKNCDENIEVNNDNAKTNNINNNTSPNGLNSNQNDLEEVKTFVRPNNFNFDNEDAAKNQKSKVSRLPVNNGFRRSLNLDMLPSSEPVKYTKSDRRSLKLDLTQKPNNNLNNNNNNIAQPSTSRDYNRNSMTEYDSSVFLSPDDNASDSWSICSDYHPHHDLLSPVSPQNGHYHICSGDENESVIDRIRRKSFYTRFNENKRPRKTSLGRNYKDLDLYKDLTYRPSTEYGSLDRRSYDYGKSASKACFGYQEPKREYKRYSGSQSLMNDYVNVPKRYQTYSSKIGRPVNTGVSSLYADHPDDNRALDELLTAAKSKK